jgi:hypothetical protein
VDSFRKVVQKVCAPSIARRAVLEYEQMSAEAKLKELGYALPQLPAPGGNYLPAKVVGNMVFLA